MEMKLSPKKMAGVLPAVTAKASGHRLLLAAALSDTPCLVKMSSPYSDDLLATMDGIRALGGSVTLTDEGALVTPVLKDRASVKLFANESGTTARFLLPVASALCDEVTLSGAGKLPFRPFTPLTDAMALGGVETTFPDSGAFLPLQTKGRLQAAEFLLPGNISSQYISGLLFALPLLGGGSIRLTTPLESEPYVFMTIAVLRRFGVSVTEHYEGEHRIFQTSGNYQAPSVVQAEGDWSAAAFYLVAGSFGGPVTLTGLSEESEQGDQKILALLEESGAKVERFEDKISVAYKENNPFICSAEQIPDLVPILAVRAAAAKGESRIHSCGRLRIKESDRLAAVVDLITSLGGEACCEGDTLIIRGKGNLMGGVAKLPFDHRMVMSAAVASCICENEVFLSNTASVSKSDPAFFARLEAIGGQIDRL